MRVYVDSSTREACVVFGDEMPNILTYGQPTTNNAGEYQAVILALEHLRMRGCKGGEILTDSLLVVNQVSGVWKCRAEHLIPLRDKVRELLKNTGIELKWTPREANKAGFHLP